MWEDDGPADVAAPKAGARGAWKAPAATAAPSGRRVEPRERARQKTSPDLGPTSAMENGPVPRRTKNYAPLRPWWRPGGRVAQIALGSATLALFTGLGALGFVTYRFLIGDGHFRIPGASSIQSTGLSEVSRGEILPIFGEDIGRNIFFVPLGARRKQLEAIPWVRQATVMRFLPDQLSVSIVERTPVAFVRQGQFAQQVELADADGVILQMPPAMMAQHHYSFPVVTGINAADPPAARQQRMAVYTRFVAELDQNQQHLSEQVSEIDLSDPEDLRAMMPEQGTDILAHFGQEQFLHRLQIYQAHIGEWRQRYPRLIGVDLRYNGEVPLEMGTGENASGPAVTAPLAPDTVKSAPAASVASVKPTETKPTAKAPVPKPVQAKAVTKTTPAKKKVKPAPVLTAAQKKAAKKKVANLKGAKAKVGKPSSGKGSAAKAPVHKAAGQAPAAKGAQAQGQ